MTGHRYQVIETSIADARRLLRYKAEEAFGASFSIKGFDYPWIVSKYNWPKQARVLDVGGGYSPLPVHLADHYGCEVWSVDDFGLASDERFWTRNQDPHEYTEQTPQVNFVFERLGDPGESSLPEAYFDCVYSASTLEHVPAQLAVEVWRHMDLLLKPGGTMLHAVDMKLPTHRGLLSILKALALDGLRPLLPRLARIRNLYYTPRSYLTMVESALSTRFRKDSSQFSPIRLCLDPEIVLEPLDWAYNRFVKDGLRDIPIQRVTSLLIHLRKGSG